MSKIEDLPLLVQEYNLNEKQTRLAGELLLSGKTFTEIVVKLFEKDKPQNFASKPF